MGRSLLKEDTPSSPPLNVKSSEMSRKSFATSPWTSNPRWPPPPPPPPSKRATNCQMDKSSPSETKDSVAQKPSSNHPSSVRIFTETTSFPEVPPCTQVLPTECKRKSPVLPHPLSNPCGSPRPTTMKLVHPLSTENASKFAVLLTLYRIFFLYKLHWI